MFPGSMNGGTKWQALEVQTKEPHKCIQQQQQQQSEITPPKTIQNVNPAIHHFTNDEEIAALKARLVKVESWIKKFSESAAMNL
jgi:hypothetical protein